MAAQEASGVMAAAMLRQQGNERGFSLGVRGGGDNEGDGKAGGRRII